MKIRPLYDRVLVEMDPIEEMFGDSGLVRPHIAHDKPMIGTVRGVGPLATLRPGERVLVPWARGHDMVIADRFHVMAREFSENDIIAVVEDDSV